MDSRLRLFDRATTVATLTWDVWIGEPHGPSDLADRPPRPPTDELTAAVVALLRADARVRSAPLRQIAERAFCSDPALSLPVAPALRSSGAFPTLKRLLREQVRSQSTSEETRRAAAAALLAWGGGGRQTLGLIVNSGHLPGQRPALGRAAERGHWDLVERAATSEQTSVRLMAITTLATRTPRREGARQLLAVIERLEGLGLPAATARRELGKLASDPAVADLLAETCRERAVGWMTAALALGRSQGGSQVVAALISALGDRRASAAACGSLLRLPGPEPLRQCLAVVSGRDPSEADLPRYILEPATGTRGWGDFHARLSAARVVRQKLSREQRLVKACELLARSSIGERVGGAALLFHIGPPLPGNLVDKLVRALALLRFEKGPSLSASAQAVVEDVYASPAASVFIRALAAGREQPVVHDLLERARNSSSSTVLTWLALGLGAEAHMTDAVGASYLWRADDADLTEHVREVAREASGPDAQIAYSLLQMLGGRSRPETKVEAATLLARWAAHPPVEELLLSALESVSGQDVAREALERTGRLRPEGAGFLIQLSLAGSHAGSSVLQRLAPRCPKTRAAVRSAGRSGALRWRVVAALTGDDTEVSRAWATALRAVQPDYAALTALSEAADVGDWRARAARDALWGAADDARCREWLIRMVVGGPWHGTAGRALRGKLGVRRVREAVAGLSGALRREVLTEGISGDRRLRLVGDTVRTGAELAQLETR